MSEPENFISRWSRRKLGPADENAAADKPAVEGKAAEGEAAENPDALALARKSKSPPVPEFDLASLPPIESIGADSDIGAFLKPGVPSGLRHAALRRAWAVDPSIRDFKGLQENDWNFNDPNGIPGFGELGPEHDVGKMLRQLFGDETASGAVDAPEPQQAGEQPIASLRESGIPGGGESALPVTKQVASAASDESSPQREENIAMQQDESSDEPPANQVRRHGGALPR